MPIMYVHMHMGRAYFKNRGVKKESVQDMIKVELTNVPVETWIILILNHIWDRVLNTLALR